MSDWEIVTDAIIADLRDNVPSLVEVKESNIHRLAPWSPQELTADGERHLAVWPAPGDAEIAEPMTTDAHMLNQVYIILYWESSGTEGPRLVGDEAGAATLLDLHNAVRDRIYRMSFQTIGASDRVWYIDTSFPEVVSRVRGFEIRLSVRRIKEFSA